MITGTGPLGLAFVVAVRCFHLKEAFQASDGGGARGRALHMTREYNWPRTAPGRPVATLASCLETAPVNIRIPTAHRGVVGVCYLLPIFACLVSRHFVVGAPDRGLSTKLSVCLSVWLKAASPKLSFFWKALRSHAGSWGLSAGWIDRPATRPGCVGRQNRVHVV